MKRIEIGQWMIKVDAEATRQVYEKTSRGSPANCDCNTCRNFTALGREAYPEPFRSLLNELGIDYRKAAEVFYTCPSSSSHLFYGGWFHFAGRIISGPHKTPDFRPLPEGLEISICRDNDLVFEEFGDKPLVQIEFSTDSIPWVLDEEMPE
ncbi:MAG: hypothetical protein E3J72_05355 [Planctomycetota bacterium]|nr:MAG: hypothetical protein E3J72_05355 [Planctomycetota bacterium]